MLTLAKGLKRFSKHKNNQQNLTTNTIYQKLYQRKPGFIKHEKERICNVASDVIRFHYIPDGNNGHKLAYLIGIIDHSRRDMHSNFTLMQHYQDLKIL